MSAFDLQLPQALPAHHQPVVIKQQPSDFKVTEELGFELTEEGEFFCLYVEKTGQNTQWVAQQLAKAAGLPLSAISYSGLKDRQGICKQWFCLHLPGKSDPDTSTWDIEGVCILQVQRHRKKIRRGVHRANIFELMVHNLPESENISDRLNQIQTQGVPNYFGPQRFGHAGHNLDQALALFTGQIKLRKAQRSFALSAARSWIFNQMLATRVQQDNWNQFIEGDVLGFASSNSIIQPDNQDESCLDKIASGALVPTGALWGKGALLSQSTAADIENHCAQQTPDFAQGLIQAGLQQERRKLVLRPEQLQWTWVSDTSLQLTFTLTRGCFATSILHELVGYGDSL